MPRDIIRAPDHDRGRSLGWLALAWLEHFAVHGPGDVEGRSLDPDDPDGIPLDDERAGLILDHYALAGNGRRLYDSAFTSRSKGWAKSEIAALEVLFEGFGPCRFAGWAAGGEIFEWRDFVWEYQPGEPMGRQVTYPFIRCIATEEDQAGNTYGTVLFNLTDGPLGEGLPRDAAGVTRIAIPTGGEIIPSTAADASKDGGKETHVVFDETHLYTKPSLRLMYNTVRRNLGKRKDSEPWSHETSTMYAVGEESVAEATHAFAKSIAEGRTRQSRLFFDHRQSGPVDLTDEESIRDALRQAYGPAFAFIDVERKIAEIWDPRNSPADTLRYTFNQPSSVEDAWVTAAQVDARNVGDQVVDDGDPVVLGFDGSRSRARGVTDATALIAVRVADGYSWPVGIWEQPEGPTGDGWEVPVAQIDQAVRTAFDTMHVVGFFADPALWESYVANWEADYGKRLKVKAGGRHPIQWWMNRDRAVVAALEQAHNAIADGSMSHNGDPVFRRHLLNARIRKTRSGVHIAKEHPQSWRKIDAAAAWTLAWQARLAAVAAGVKPRKPTRKVPRRLR
jgi:hypothetical protein